MATQQHWYDKPIAWLSPLATLLTMFGIIIGAGIASWSVVVKPRNLAVYVHKQEVNFPVSINDRFTRVYNYMVDSCRNRSLDSDVSATLEYLQNTDKFWVITLHNQTDNTIKGIGVRVNGVTALGSWAVTGDYLNDSEKTALMRGVRFDTVSKIIYLDKIESLRPGADFKLYLWGRMDDISLWTNLAVNYEGGDARAGEEYTVTGFKAFLCEYLYEILSIIAALFFVVYGFAIRRERRVAANTLTQNTATPNNVSP